MRSFLSPAPIMDHGLGPRCCLLACPDNEDQQEPLEGRRVALQRYRTVESVPGGTQHLTMPERTEVFTRLRGRLLKHLLYDIYHKPGWAHVQGVWLGPGMTVDQ